MHYDTCKRDIKRSSFGYIGSSFLVLFSVTQVYSINIMFYLRNGSNKLPILNLDASLMRY